MAEILIIGGGVSGLSAGIYAQMHGHHAVVCEKHSIAGGNLTGWDRGEYHIDNCIHWLTGTNPHSKTYRMWEELGVLGGVEIMQEETLFTCEYGGQTLSLNKDLRKFEQDMLSISPEDEKEIRSLVKAIDYLQGVCGIAGETHDQKSSAAQKLVRLPQLLKYYKMTTGDLSKCFRHPLLSFFFRAFWGEEFGAFALIFVMAHFCGENGGIPRGSSCAMAERMTERFHSLGGDLLLKKEVVKINAEDGKASSVSFTDGTTIQADYVIITNDPADAFANLIDAPMPKKLRKSYRDVRMKRFSSYHCAFACEMSELPFEGDYIFEVPEEYRSTLHTNQLIVRGFSHEPSFAPKGNNILQTLTFVFEEDAKTFIKLKQRSKEEYRRKKQEISQILQMLIEKHFPQMQDKLKCIDVWTPATYRRFTGTEIGSWMSFALPSKKIPFRIGNRIKGVSNVFLATQWQQSPGGLPIAAEGGMLAIKSILKLEGRKCRTTGLT